MNALFPPPDIPTIRPAISGVIARLDCSGWERKLRAGAWVDGNADRPAIRAADQ